LLRLTDNRLVLAGSSESRRALDRAECLCRTSPSRLSSAFIPFSVCQSGTLFVEGSRPSNHPASAFGCAPAVFGTTPLRRRLTSSRRRPWNGKPIMRHRPLSRWRSAIGSVVAPIWSIERASMKPSDRQRSWDSFDPSQLCSCMTGELFGRPDRSHPACRFMNVRPGVFYAGDRSPNLFYLVSDRSRDVHSDFRDLHLPCTQAHPMTDLRDRIVHAALGFSCFRFPGRRNRRAFRAFDGSSTHQPLQALS